MEPSLPEPPDEARVDAAVGPPVVSHDVALGRIRDRLDRAKEQLDEMEGVTDDGGG